MTPLPEPNGWLPGGRPAITCDKAQSYAQQAAKAERKAALLWAAEHCMTIAADFGGAKACAFGAEKCAAMLRDEAEKIK